MHDLNVSGNTCEELCGESGPEVLKNSRATLPDQRRRTGAYGCAVFDMLELEIMLDGNFITNLDCFYLDRSKPENIYAVFRRKM